MHVAHDIVPSLAFRRAISMKKIVFGLGIAGALTAATATGAWAGWGCGIKGTLGNDNRGYEHNDFAEATQAQAEADLIQNCKQNGIANCKIISCSANVDTAQQAGALWPICGGPNQPKC
jgi:hypothetical protein